MKQSSIRYGLNHIEEKLWLWLARHMPRRLRYWATIVTGAEASQGQWSNQEVPAMLFMDAVKRTDPYRN